MTYLLHNPFATSDNASDFERIRNAKRGTFRTERGDYIIIAHCHTTPIVPEFSATITRWYVSIYGSVGHISERIAHQEFSADDLTYDVLEAYIVGVIVANEKELTV